MGTASIVIGLILILFGFGLIVQVLMSSEPTQEEWNNSFYAVLVISIPIIVVGAVFLRKYDNDKRRFAEKDESALDILKERYAKGEITKEEFEQKKKDLENS